MEELNKLLRKQWEEQKMRIQYIGIQLHWRWAPERWRMLWRSMRR